MLCTLLETRAEELKKIREIGSNKAILEAEEQKKTEIEMETARKLRLQQAMEDDKRRREEIGTTVNLDEDRDAMMNMMIEEESNW